MSTDTYSWDSRIAFVVRYMYDIDNNGFLDQKDFDCMALRATIIEGKGECHPEKLAQFQDIMRNLWTELSDLADFDKDGMITTDEFKEAVRKTCVGKKYADFPKAMKAFIEANFKMIDIDGDGVVGVNEFRYNCIQRLATDDIKVVDEAYNQLVNDNDKATGGLTLQRYQELYGDFLGKTERNPGCYLFGPLGGDEFHWGSQHGRDIVTTNYHKMDFLSGIKEKDELLSLLNVAIDKIYKRETSNKFTKFSSELDYIAKIYMQYCSNQLTKTELLEYFPVDDDFKDCIYKAIEVRNPQICRYLVNLHNSTQIPLMKSFDWDLKLILGNSSLASFREQRATLMLNCLKGSQDEYLSVELNREMVDKLIHELENTP